MDAKENLVRKKRGKKAGKCRYITKLRKISQFHRYDLKPLRNHSHCTYYPSLLDLKGFLNQRNATLVLTHT